MLGDCRQRLIDLAFPAVLLQAQGQVRELKHQTKLQTDP